MRDPVDSEVEAQYDDSPGPHNGRLYMAYAEAPSVSADSDDTNIYTS